MSFERDVAAFAKQAGLNLGQAARAIKIEIFSDCIRNTRVDRGRLRGNWQTTTGAPASSATERLDPSGAQAISDVRAKVSDFGVDYLTNNLPYAAIWDQRDGIRSRAIARLDSILRKVGNEFS